jgi:hypothetical protein
MVETAEKFMKKRRKKYGKDKNPCEVAYLSDRFLTVR